MPAITKTNVYGEELGDGGGVGLVRSKHTQHIVLEADGTGLASSLNRFISLDAFDFRKQKTQC